MSNPRLKSSGEPKQGWTLGTGRQLTRGARIGAELLLMGDILRDDARDAHVHEVDVVPGRGGGEGVRARARGKRSARKQRQMHSGSTRHVREEGFRRGNALCFWRGEVLGLSPPH